MNPTIDADYFVLRIGRLTLNLEIQQQAAKATQDENVALRNAMTSMESDLETARARVSELEAIIDSIEDDDDEDTTSLVN